MAVEKYQIAVVGAGLVGSLLAIMLKKQGYQVAVFERRPDMRKLAIGEGRSINLVVTSGGLPLSPHRTKRKGFEYHSCR